jgi:hypothetical protein
MIIIGVWNSKVRGVLTKNVAHQGKIYKKIKGH